MVSNRTLKKHGFLITYSQRFGSRVIQEKNENKRYFTTHNISKYIYFWSKNA
jgi:hypothetical protein